MKTKLEKVFYYLLVFIYIFAIISVFLFLAIFRAPVEKVYIGFESYYKIPKQEFYSMTFIELILLILVAVEFILAILIIRNNYLKKFMNKLK